jgi:peptidoglycan LD-endopeptidase CwlK
MSIIISRDKSLLYPPFAEQLRDFESRLGAAKLPFYLFMALRTFECQDELYAQGRTLPGKIVTNARGGDSLHNFGLASDWVLDGQGEKPGIQWRWDTRVNFNADGKNDWIQMEGGYRRHAAQIRTTWRRISRGYELLGFPLNSRLPS